MVALSFGERATVAISVQSFAPTTQTKRSSETTVFLKLFSRLT
jgi:hypothetical protein